MPAGIFLGLVDKIGKSQARLKLDSSRSYSDSLILIVLFCYLTTVPAE